MKPECEACKQVPPDSFSSTLGEDLMAKLLYRIFNPEAESQENQNTLDLNSLLQDSSGDLGEDGEASPEGYLEKWSRASGNDWVKEYMRQKKAREKAWKSIMEKLRKGEVKPSDLSVDQLLQNFLNMVIEGLSQEGLVDLKVYRHWMNQNVYLAYPEFTEKSEKVIAQKVLEETFLNLKKYMRGPHVIEEGGLGVEPTHIIREYDDFQHTYDMLDIQETLIHTASRDPAGMRIEESDLKARIPHHETKSANVILVDCSYSMRGDKFRGGIMAALAFRELLREEYHEDALHVIAYNQKPQVLHEGQVIRLKPFGYTDIGQAIDLSTEILFKEEGNRNIFLITDGEPTATYHRDQTPEESTLKAAYLAGKQDVCLNVIMLDRRHELKRICEKMAQLNGNATVAYVENPLNLKEFVIRTYVDFKRTGWRHPA